MKQPSPIAGGVRAEFHTGGGATQLWHTVIKGAGRLQSLVCSLKKLGCFSSQVEQLSLFEPKLTSNVKQEFLALRSLNIFLKMI